MNKVQREKNISAVVLLLKRFERTAWVKTTLSSHLGLDENELERVLEWLTGEELAYMDACYIKLTQAGLDYAESLKDRPQLDTCASMLQFKQEALTGIKEEKGDAGFMVSRKSEITRAVLMTDSKKSKSGKNPERLIMEQDLIVKGRERLPSMLGLELEQCAQYMSEGRIKICARCGELAVHDRDGKYIKSHCRKCRKEARRRK